jgi:hypothetical protein
MCATVTRSRFRPNSSTNACRELGDMLHAVLKWLGTPSLRYEARRAAIKAAILS